MPNLDLNALLPYTSSLAIFAAVFAAFMVGLWLLTPRDVRTVLRNAFSVCLENFDIVVIIAVLTGGLGLLVTDALGSAAAKGLDVGGGKAELITAFLVQSVLLCGWAGVVGSWAAPAQIYLWVQREKRLRSTLVGAINFGLNRWKRVGGPHAAAYGIIALGNIVVVPGIIFGLQYAFVDAIATLDKAEQRPLARSERLASARRGTIFRAMLPFFFGWWLWYALGLTFLLPTMPWWGKLALGTVDHLVLILVDLAMVQIYLDLFRKPTAEPASALPAH